MRTARMLVALAALALTVSTADAQVRGIVGAGLSVPVGDFADEDLGAAETGGVNLLLGAEWVPAGRMFGVRVDGTFAQFCTTFCDDDDLDVKYRIYNGNLSGMLQLGGDAASVHPYLLAGVGLYNYRLSGDDAPDGFSETDFGVSGGAGIGFALGRVSLFGEARFHNVFGEDADLQYIPVTIGARVPLR